MKTLLIFCLLLFVAFCLFNAVHSSGSGNKPATIINGWEQPQKESQASEVRPQSVSALKLFIDYQRNEVAADNIYKGHLLAVQGMVTSISKDMFDKIYVSLATPNEFMNVQAHLNEGSESQAAALQRGEVITIVCTGGGMILGSPMLQNCSFANAQDNSEDVANTPPMPVAEQPQPTQVVQKDDTGANNAVTIPAPQQAAVGADGLYKIGGDVLAPVLISSAEPEFPEEARQAKIGSNVLVNMWVGTDGLPSHVHAIRVLYVDHEGHASSGPNSMGNGLGFEEKAVEAVKQYRFKPAIDNGKPVLVELNVEVNFQIF